MHDLLAPIYIGSTLYLALVALLKWKHRQTQRRLSKGLRAYAATAQAIS